MGRRERIEREENDVPLCLMLWQWERERAGLWNAGSLAWQPLQPWKHSSCGCLHWASTGKGESSVRHGLGRHSQSPASLSWTLAPGSWGGEITVFSCVAQVSPADSTGQFQTIVRQMVLVKLSGSQNETKGHEYKSRPCMELRAKRSGKETWEEGVENNQNALCTCMKQPNTNLTKIRS